MRFSDYNDSLKNICLSELLYFQNGINADSDKYGKGIKYISVGDIINNDYITYDCIKGKVDISQKELNNYLVENGDILFQRSSETFEDIGNANVYLDEQPCTFGGFVIRGKKIGEYDPKYLNYLLKSPNARKQVIRLGAGAQHYNISQESLNKIILSFPSAKEQEKISRFLTKIEEQIQLQNKIIEEYSTLKNRINDLFFNDKDKFYKFSDLYEFAKEGGTPSTKNTEFYENGTIPFIKIEDLDRKYIKTNGSFINEKGLSHSSAWIIPTNSIILSNGATIGSVSINMYPVSTKQGILGIIPSKLVSTEYMYYLLTRSDFRRKLKSITTRGTMETAYLKDIDTIELPIPNRCMQEKQCKVLSSIDNRIDVEKEILNNLIVQKQYLLNNIFI